MNVHGPPAIRQWLGPSYASPNSSGREVSWFPCSKSVFSPLQKSHHINTLKTYLITWKHLNWLIWNYFQIRYMCQHFKHAVHLDKWRGVLIARDILIYFRSCIEGDRWVRRLFLRSNQWRFEQEEKKEAGRFLRRFPSKYRHCKQYIQFRFSILTQHRPLDVCILLFLLVGQRWLSCWGPGRKM